MSDIFKLLCTSKATVSYFYASFSPLVSFVSSPPISEPWAVQNHLLNFDLRVTIQAVRGMKNAPRPCLRKTPARAGERF